jgi:membrane-associated phospholipid phosphatase
VNSAAKVISVLLHPLLMPTYLFTLLAFLFPASLYPITPASRVAFLILLFLMTCLLPAVNIGFLRLFGVVKSVSMNDREERIKPFVLITLLYVVFTAMLHLKRGLSIGDNLFNLLLIIDVLVVFSLLITFFYKASIHSVGICGIVGMLLPLNKVMEDYSIFIATLVALVLAGVVMSARLQLNAHTPREVLVGAVAGFAIGFFGMLLLF